MPNQNSASYAANEFNRWLSLTSGDKYHEKVAELKGNTEEIEDAFSKSVSFGNSGVRALLGPGTNRINKFVVRRISQGIANYMKKEHKPVSVVIGYDSRRGSKFFAHQAASVFRANLIKPYMFATITPSSLLSYAVRALGCDLGIMITGSHDPKIYNGYKVYNGEGHQIFGEMTEGISEEIEKIDYFGPDITIDPSGEGIFKVKDEIKESFIKDVCSSVKPVDPEIFEDFKVVYTPLHGAGKECVSETFDRMGIKYELVSVQAEPDKEFKTCPVPNPEKIMAYDESFKWLDEHGGDIILSTDSDADRVGCAIEHDEMRTVLTGNQIGILLLDYLCHIDPPRPGQLIIRSIAASPLTDKICEKYGLKQLKTLSGFKYVGAKIAELENSGKIDDFYYAFEESNSYLIDSFVREKDGVSTALCIAEMAAFHKKRGKNLIERLYELYNEFGIYVDKTRNYFFSGPEAQSTMSAIMDFFRNRVNNTIGGRNVVGKTDYLGAEGLPKADIVELDLDDGSKLIIRPSDTEPVIKIYSFETCDFSEVEKEIADIVDRYKSVIKDNNE